MARPPVFVASLDGRDLELVELEHREGVDAAPPVFAPNHAQSMPAGG